jgi:drug/metabolite transporter (DMT)-like permease
MVARRRRSKMYFAIFIIVLCAIIGSAGQILLKKGLNVIGTVSLKDMLGPNVFKVVFQPFVFSGIALYAFSMLLWIYALSNFDVSFAFPLVSLSYVFAGIFSIIFLKETIPVMRWAGIFVIVTGCFMIIKT